MLARMALRAIAGSPAQMQILYGAGERRIDEYERPGW